MTTEQTATQSYRKQGQKNDIDCDMFRLTADTLETDRR